MDRPDRREGERGQALPLFVLMLIALLAATGLVVDVGGAWAQERSQQKVADMAALAGATVEANVGTKQQIMDAALASAVANGFDASEVEVNIPPTSGTYAPGGGKDAMLANDCSTPALFPCWVEVVIDREHSNFFAGIVGQGSWDVSARGVAVGGIANGVSNALAPLMFNVDAVFKDDGTGTGGVVVDTSSTLYCNPQDHKCIPNSDFPTSEAQFNWTTVCVTGGACNVNTDDVVNIIDGGFFTTSAWAEMDLGANNQGQHTAACYALLEDYPDGITVPVVINDDNGDLVGFWMWTFEPENTDCEGVDGMQIGGHFEADAFGDYPTGNTAESPLTITSGAPPVAFGIPVVKLVE